MVAEFQPEGGEPALQELRRRQAHVTGFGTAFPAVQQQRQPARFGARHDTVQPVQAYAGAAVDEVAGGDRTGRSEEHTSELQSLMRISYDVCCLKKKNQ